MVAGRSRPALAEGDVVLGRAPRVAVPLDQDEHLWVRLEPLDVRLEDLRVVGPDVVLVEVEVDRLHLGDRREVLRYGPARLGRRWRRRRSGDGRWRLRRLGSARRRRGGQRRRGDGRRQRSDTREHDPHRRVGIADCADHLVTLDLEVSPKETAAELVAHVDLVARRLERHAHTGEPGVAQRRRHRRGGVGRVQREPPDTAPALLEEVRCRVVGARDAHDVPPPRSAPLAGDIHIAGVPGR